MTEKQGNYLSTVPTIYSMPIIYWLNMKNKFYIFFTTILLMYAKKKNVGNSGNGETNK